MAIKLFSNQNIEELEKEVNNFILQTPSADVVDFSAINITEVKTSNVGCPSPIRIMHFCQIYYFNKDK